MMQTRTKVESTIKLSEYGPENPKWIDGSIPHVESHEFIFQYPDGTIIKVTLGHISRLVQAADDYITPGKALDALYLNAPNIKGK